ncbi:MAG: ribosome maturation factor RimM [Burkholderiaceae bacterium]
MHVGHDRTRHNGEMEKNSTGGAIPDDLVLVGYISGAYGLNGWVRIAPYATDAGALLTARTWWLDKPELHDVDMLQSKMHSGDVVALLMGVASREAAEMLRGTEVHISRARFPALSDDEFYWIDLIGLEVENLQGDILGRVAGLIDNGAQPVLRVIVRPADDATGTTDAQNRLGSGGAAKVEAASAKNPAGMAEHGKEVPEMLIPFVDQFVRAVDHTTNTITVDWERDY